MQLGRYLMALAEAKVISKAEAEKADLSKMSMISKIRKIDEHRDLILHPIIADKICTGYSVLYELGRLIDVLPADGDRAALLNSHLEGLDGDLTRKWAKDVRESIAPKEPKEPKKKAKKAKKAKAASDPEANATASEEFVVPVRQQGDDGFDESGQDQDVERELDNVTGPDVLMAGAGDLITAALLIITEENEERMYLAAQYSRWHRIADKMAKDFVVFIFSPLQVLLDIIQTIGTFACRCAHVYQLTEPDELALTECNVLAIFERGESITVEGVPNWKPDDTHPSIAEQFLRGVPGRRLQIFADGPVDGWDALTFDEDFTPHLHCSPA